MGDTWCAIKNLAAGEGCREDNSSRGREVGKFADLWTIKKREGFCMARAQEALKWGEIRLEERALDWEYLCAIMSMIGLHSCKTCFVTFQRVSLTVSILWAETIASDSSGPCTLCITGAQFISVELVTVSPYLYLVGSCCHTFWDSFKIRLLFLMGCYAEWDLSSPNV